MHMEAKVYERDGIVLYHALCLDHRPDPGGCEVFVPSSSTGVSAIDGVRFDYSD